MINFLRISKKDHGESSVKRHTFIWLFPIIVLGLWLILPAGVLADLPMQVGDGSATPTPTPRPLYPEDVTVPQTHFPGLIVGAIVIIVIILVGALIRPRK